MIHFILLQNCKGKTLLSKWYTKEYEIEKEDIEKTEIEGELHRAVISRDRRTTSSFEHGPYKHPDPGNGQERKNGPYKIIYRFYAGMFLMVAVDLNDNEKPIKELIQTFIKAMNAHIGCVSESDLVFHLNKVHEILDELLLSGEERERRDEEARTLKARTKHRQEVADNQQADFEKVLAAAQEAGLDLGLNHLMQRQAEVAGSVAAAAPPWEEGQQQAEGLVNERLNRTLKQPAGEASAAEDVICFNSQRTFKQVQAKQHRASEEVRLVGMERRALAGGGAMMTGNRTNFAGTNFAGTASSRLGATSAPAASMRSGTQLLQFSYNTAKQAPSRGAGSHSVQATGGVRGHFHNSSAAHKLHMDDPHRWPGSIAPELEGAHIDHTKAAPLKADPKYSKLTAEEKSRQFSCFFKKEDNFKRKCVASTHVAGDGGKYQPWNAPVFRADQPQRHGKFGRRVFDPQVKERPTLNPDGISEIESQPVEEFFHQQDRVHEFLDRALPPGQDRHFQTYLSRSEFPKKSEDMVSREQIRSHMDGDQKVPMLGWGQNRHSDHTDYKLYSRPLGTSHMDRLIPLA